MFMAVENMAHDNMSVNYIIISAKKPTYDKIQGQEKNETVVIKLCCIFESDKYKWTVFWVQSQSVNKGSCISEAASAQSWH